MIGRMVMHSGTIEHANLTVSDIERSSALFQKLLGWRERWRGEGRDGGETIHVGDDHAYLALWTDRQPHARFAKGEPLNHVGLVVERNSLGGRVTPTHERRRDHEDEEPNDDQDHRHASARSRRWCWPWRCCRRP